MDNNTVLVLSDPTDPLLAILEELPPETGLVVGNSREAFERSAGDGTVIFGWPGSRELIRDVLGMAPKVRWVHSRAAGLDNLLSPELVESPAVVTNGTGVFSASLGEFVLGAILYFAKDFRRMIRNQENRRWEPFDIEPIEGKTVGIVGYGDIGRACAERVRALGMKVLAVKRHAAGQSDPVAEQIYTPDRTAEMMARCDYVVVAAPLTPETHHMVGETEFAAMKPTAVMINVGRGPVIDEAAMVRALGEGRIKGAGLDVFEHEPLPDGHPFYSMENVLLSPHCADHTPDWLEKAMRFFVAQYGRFEKGEPLLNVVDKRLGY